MRNLGDGNLSNRGALSNLKGNAGAGSGAFVGSGGSIDLADGASVEFPYSFHPITHGPQSAVLGLAFTNGSPAGTNQAHNVNAELKGVGVGPEFGSSRVPGSVIDFGEVASGQTSLQSLNVSNITPEGNLGNLTDLTLLSAIITGPDAGMFSLRLFTPGTVLSAAEAIDLDLSFDPQGQSGAFQAMLQLTTDQGAAFGAAGQLFAYQLAGSSATSMPGDFNTNGQLDVADIDLLTAQVITGTNDPVYDLNNNALVDQTDRGVWVQELRNTWFGDASLDGEFNSNDMVNVFAVGKYETGETAGWAAGDWDGDGLFSSSDMVVAFVDGGYEQGFRTPAMAVPEPGTATGLLVSLVIVSNLPDGAGHGKNQECPHSSLASKWQTYGLLCMACRTCRAPDSHSSRSFMPCWAGVTDRLRWSLPVMEFPTRWRTCEARCWGTSWPTAATNRSVSSKAQDSRIGATSVSVTLFE